MVTTISGKYYPPKSEKLTIGQMCDLEEMLRPGETVEDLNIGDEKRGNRRISRRGLMLYANVIYGKETAREMRELPDGELAEISIEILQIIKRTYDVPGIVRHEESEDAGKNPEAHPEPSEKSEE